MRLPWVSRKHLEWVITRAASRNATLRQELEIAEDSLEAERQWRLTSLPALLAAEERALQAEARCAELEAAVTRELTTQFPELGGFPDGPIATFVAADTLRHSRALINAYHAETERP